MARIEINTNIKSLLDFYREEHRIYGRCPHCGEAFRLSEARLTYGKEPPRDLLTRLKAERDRLAEQIEELEGESDQTNEDHEVELAQLQEGHEAELANLGEKWETELGVRVEKSIEKEKKKIRQQAIQRSRVTTLGKTIGRIAPMFSGFGHHPGDVRALFDPIDFLVFTGLYPAGEVEELVFMEFKTGDSKLTKTQKAIRAAVDHKRVRFEEARISAETLKRIVSGSANRKPLIEARER